MQIKAKDRTLYRIWPTCLVFIERSKGLKDLIETLTVVESPNGIFPETVFQEVVGLGPKDMEGS